MNKIVITILLLISIHLTGRCQENLVLNPGIEDVIKYKTTTFSKAEERNVTGVRCFANSFQPGIRKKYIGLSVSSNLAKYAWHTRALPELLLGYTRHLLKGGPAFFGGNAYSELVTGLRIVYEYSFFSSETIQ